MLILSKINLRNKFEGPSLINSKDMTTDNGAKFVILRHLTWPSCVKI